MLGLTLQATGIPDEDAFGAAAVATRQLLEAAGISDGADAFGVHTIGGPISAVRITEESNRRVTESGLIRITEGDGGQQEDLSMRGAFFLCF